MKQQTLPEMQAMIMNMDNDELDSIAVTIKFRRSQIQQEVKKLFKVGDKVFFMSRKNGKGKIEGEITKINKKYIVVDETNGISRYTVSPTLLERS
mgnify:CR=1 FL=1|tara:strand:- start:265 stop:549 length:285 start_codon:yes stop_codon:yes gene_type:complete